MNEKSLKQSRKRKGFPGCSVAKKKKKSACNAGDTGPIPGLERSLGEGNDKPHQYSSLGNIEEPGRLQSIGSQKSQT